MFSSGDLQLLMEQILGQLGQQQAGSDGVKAAGKGSGASSKIMENFIAGITPAKAVIIGGILTQVLELKSVLVDRDQIVEVVLQGSLRRKTEADKLMDQLGPMPFDEVIKAIGNRIS